MKKKILSMTTAIFLIFNQSLSASGNIIPNPSRINTLEELISLIAGLVRPLFLITFVAMILYGAFIYLTAGDKEDKVKSARQIIIAAIIGFVIAVFAPTIIDLVAKYLGVPGLSISSPNP